MSELEKEQPFLVPPVDATDDAVGISESEKKWFVGITRTHCERKIEDVLRREDYEVYLPSQTETHEWSRKRKRTITRLVIPGYIFIYCSEERRRVIFTDLKPLTQPFLSRFLVNRLSKKNEFGIHSVATIPDDQMQKLMYMVGYSDEPVYLESTPLHVGDTIRIIRGKLKGFIGELEILPDKTSKLIIRLNALGAAKINVNRNDVQIIK